jgi:hypothetical protein
VCWSAPLHSIRHSFTTSLSCAYEQEGLNLSVLLTTLVPSGMVREEDTAWTFESLLRVSVVWWCVAWLIHKGIHFPRPADPLIAHRFR